MNKLYVFGRAQDYSYSLPDPRFNVAQRHHLRIWKTDRLANGVPLWVAAATHDVSIKCDAILLRTSAVGHPVRAGFGNSSSKPRPCTCKTRLLFLTGHGDIPSTVRATQSGAVDFLEKRAPKEKLLDAVRRALERDEREREDRARQRELRSRFDGHQVPL